MSEYEVLFLVTGVAPGPLSEEEAIERALAEVTREMAEQVMIWEEEE